MYEELHRHSVCHIDVQSRHILEAYPPITAYNDPVELDAAVSRRPWSPNAKEMRIIDFEAAVEQATTEELEEEMRRVWECLR